MLQITSSTTIGQLAVQRSALGIESLTVVTDRITGGRLATTCVDGRVLFGHGQTEADAIEDCFAQRRKQLVEEATPHARVVPPSL